MSNQEIKETLELTKGIITLDHSQLTPQQVRAFRDIDCFAHQWLSQQATLIDQQAERYKVLREQFCDLSRERVAERDQLIAKINQGADLNRVLERDNFNAEANLQAVNSSLELAVEALEEIVKMSSGFWTSETSHAHRALLEIRGIET